MGGNGDRLKQWDMGLQIAITGRYNSSIQSDAHEQKVRNISLICLFLVCCLAVVQLRRCNWWLESTCPHVYTGVQKPAESHKESLLNLDPQ